MNVMPRKKRTPVTRTKTTTSKTPLYLALGFVIALVGTAVLLGMQTRRTMELLTPTPPPTAAPQDSQFSTNGEVVCLPHKETEGGVTLECTYGLRAEDGKYYGLTNVPQEDMISGKFATGKMVYVSGTLSPDPLSPYDTSGIIDVTEWSELENLPQ